LAHLRQKLNDHIQFQKADVRSIRLPPTDRICRRRAAITDRLTSVCETVAYKALRSTYIPGFNEVWIWVGLWYYQYQGLIHQVVVEKKQKQIFLQYCKYNYANHIFIIYILVLLLLNT